MAENEDFFGENQIFENEFSFSQSFQQSIVENSIKEEIIEENNDLIEEEEQQLEETIQPMIVQQIDNQLVVESQLEEETVAEPDPSQITESNEVLKQLVEPEEGEPQPEEEEEVAEFTVEAIVGKRRQRGRQEYCVKWLGFDESENTWEPVDNLHCQELIAEFEANQQKSVVSRRGRKAAPKTSTASSSATPTTGTTATPKTTPKGDGFARGLKPKRVIGLSEEKGQLYYCFEWIGEKETSLVISRVAKVKSPQLVIQYLQSKLTFNRKRPREPIENYRPIASKAFSLFSKANQ